MKKNRYQFNLTMNEAEHEILRKLKEEHAINVSGSFKLFLKQQLEKLEGFKESK